MNVGEREVVVVHVENGGDQRKGVLDDGHRDRVGQAVVRARSVFAVEHGSIGDHARNQGCTQESRQKQPKNIINTAHGEVPKEMRLQMMSEK